MGTKKTPWRMPQPTANETAAIQALNNGAATADQQKLALKCIIETICGYTDEPFDPENQRTTDFYLGRRNVAACILKEITLPLSILRKREEQKNERRSTKN